MGLSTKLSNVKAIYTRQKKSKYISVVFPLINGIMLKLFIMVIFTVVQPMFEESNHGWFDDRSQR